MKIRVGFVSNSSSSSFMIATKGELPVAQLRTLIKGALKVPHESPLFYLVDDIVNLLAGAEEKTIEEMAEDYSEDLAELLKGDGFLGRAVRNGFTKFYSGDAGNDGGVADNVLCDLGINYEDGELMIVKGN